MIVLRNSMAYLDKILADKNICHNLFLCHYYNFYTDIKSANGPVIPATNYSKSNGKLQQVSLLHVIEI